MFYWNTYIELYTTLSQYSTLDWPLDSLSLPVSEQNGRSSPTCRCSNKAPLVSKCAWQLSHLQWMESVVSFRGSFLPSSCCLAGNLIVFGWERMGDFWLSTATGSVTLTLTWVDYGYIVKLFPKAEFIFMYCRKLCTSSENSKIMPTPVWVLLAFVFRYKIFLNSKWKTWILPNTMHVCIY